jgi:hypothetical protein
MPAFGFGKSGIVINDADSERDAEPAARTIGRAAGKGLRWSLMGNVSTRLGTLYYIRRSW